MIRQRKRPNAKEAKTLKVMSEFKRQNWIYWPKSSTTGSLGSGKTSGIAASHSLASYLSDPRRGPADHGEHRQAAGAIASRVR
jgi:hypothetical protein